MSLSQVVICPIDWLLNDKNVGFIKCEPVRGQMPREKEMSKETQMQELAYCK